MKNSCAHPYKVRDLHSGDTICEECGLIVSERLFFEVECPDVYSKTIIDTHDLYDTELLSNALKDSKREKKNKGFKIVNNTAMNVSTTDSIVSKWFCTVKNMILSRSIEDTVKCVLSEIVKSGEYVHIAGTNRRGVLAACIYLSCLLNKEQCSRIELYSTLNISPNHFYRGRRFLYEWNEKFHSCDWFFKL